MEIVIRLEKSREQTLHYFDGLTDRQLDHTYQPGKWPVKSILHHLADAETVLFDRIRRVISERRQVIWAFDQDAWAQKLGYSDMPLQLSRGIYDTCRAGVIFQAGRHYQKSGQLDFVHSETGIRTLRDEFDKIASHNEHHLAQIAAALAGEPR